MGKWRATIRAAALVLLLLAAFAAFQPMFGGWYVHDDLPLLALSRMLENPLWLLVSDHMMGMPYFRPVGAFFWWLSTALVGDAAAAHYTLNLALHAGVALLLWRLITMAAGQFWTGFGAALLFAVHPLGVTTTLWLSDRFDLLSALFGLLGLCTAWAYRRDARGISLVATLACLLLALGSKEVAFALVPAIAMIWLWPGGRSKRLAALWLALPPSVMLAARFMVLEGMPAASFLGEQRPIDVLRRGVGSWLGMLPAYLGYGKHLGNIGIGALLLAGLLLLVVLAWPLMLRPTCSARQVPDDAPWRRDCWCLVAVGVTLILAACLVQWPMTGTLPVRAPVTVVDSRYYYLAALGLLLASAGVLARASGLASPGRYKLRGFLLVLAVAGMALPWLVVSRQMAQQRRLYSLATKPYFTAAGQALAVLPRAAPCRIFLLGADNPDFVHYVDTGVKATAPADSGLGNCLIQTSSAPWFFLVQRSSTDQLAMPLYLAQKPEGTRYPAAEIGNLAVLYRDPSVAVSPDQVPAALFLAWRDGRFVDVTAAVRAGTYPVPFFCNRAPAQCNSSQPNAPATADPD